MHVLQTEEVSREAEASRLLRLMLQLTFIGARQELRGVSTMGEVLWQLGLVVLPTI